MAEPKAVLLGGRRRGFRILLDHGDHLIHPLLNFVDLRMHFLDEIMLDRG
jgi:hypothetical protein